MASHERSLYNVDTSNDSPEQIHSPDKNARTDGQTDGRLDLLILKKFILNSRDIFNSQVQNIYNHVNAKHAIP